MLIRLFRSHLWPLRHLLALVVLFQGVQTAAILYLPTLTADIIDQGIATGDTGYIWRTGAVMLAVTLVQIVFAVIAVWFGARAAMGFGRDVRHDLFHRVTGYSAEEVDRFGAPSLITRITNDVQQVQMFVVLSATLLVTGPIMVVGGVVMAVREDGPLALLLAVSVPVLLISVGLVVVRLVPQFQAMQARIDRVNQVLREQITGLRVIRAFVREPEEIARFGAANDDLTATSLTAGRLMAFIFPMVLFVLNLSSVAAIWFAGYRIDDGAMQVGSLVAFLTYLVQILMAVTMATFVAIMAPRASVCAGRINDVLDTPPTILVVDEPVTTLPPRCEVELRGVSFRYPGAEEPVLCDIDLLATPGRTTAIIGSTGSGKTTLLELVPRLYDATAGSVLVGGVDVADLDPETLWSRIGYVPQKPFLFSGTVASNLRHGAPGATDDELWDALRIAQAAEFVAEMSDGLDTPISQGGTNVSGGQRQRLTIARAVVRRPAVYLFDDSFSALDLTTDLHLRRALAPVTADATVIVVAQRVSTIVDAQQILVLEDGRTVGLGTHAELLDGCPTYAEIVESQMEVAA